MILVQVPSDTRLYEKMIIYGKSDRIYMGCGTQETFKLA